MRFAASYHPGDQVVFRMSKYGTHPSPRALHIRPEPSGEGYRYEVDKFWTVREVRGEEVVIVTRRGKLRVVDCHDPALRRAAWWERMIYRDRFPTTSFEPSHLG